MSQQFCPECGEVFFYDIPMRRYICKSCGLYVTKDEIRDLREKERDKIHAEDTRKRKAREHGEYLEWWLGKKKR